MVVYKRWSQSEVRPYYKNTHNMSLFFVNLDNRIMGKIIIIIIIISNSNLDRVDYNSGSNRASNFKIGRAQSARRI